MARTTIEWGRARARQLRRRWRSCAQVCQTRHAKRPSARTTGPPEPRSDIPSTACSRLRPASRSRRIGAVMRHEVEPRRVASSAAARPDSRSSRWIAPRCARSLASIGSTHSSLAPWVIAASRPIGTTASTEGVISRSVVSQRSNARLGSSSRKRSSPGEPAPDRRSSSPAGGCGGGCPAPTAPYPVGALGS